MSDGIATYDWRELRKKTLHEIKLHREGKGVQLSNKRVEKLKNAPKTHFTKSNFSLCGRIRIGGLELTQNKEEVTCHYCNQLLGKPYSK